MAELQLASPCLFGLESIVGDELKRLGFNNVNVENGRVLYTGGIEDIARANIRLRCAERVLILLKQFRALTFDELFEGVRAIDWHDYIPKDGVFPVSGHSLDSKLFSVPDCQSIIKKAVVEQLKSKYNINWFDETGQRFQIKFTIMKDNVSVYLDTSGVGLHKRGYRAIGNAAPLRETLAAAMVLLSRYRGRGNFLDPFCGSGTIAIEAAMIAKNIAPGANRKFDANHWPWIDSSTWQKARNDVRHFDGDYSITGCDNDPKAVAIAISNAQKAGVGELVKFRTDDATASRVPTGSLIVTNPPYGERLGDLQESERIYRAFGQTFDNIKESMAYILSPHPEFEQHFGANAVKKRKLYNGMIKCNLFMYF